MVNRTTDIDPEIEEFYNELDSAYIETVDIDGEILVRRNNSKLHACKKGTVGVRFLCRDHGINIKYSASSLDIMDRREFVESERLCKNCKRMIQSETGLERVVVAVGEDESEAEAIERFCQKLDEKS